MRTRYLASDCFSAAAGTLADFLPLSLPLPRFTASPINRAGDGNFITPEIDLDVSISSEIDALRFETALSIFMEDVIPRFQKICVSQDDSEKIDEFLYDEASLTSPPDLNLDTRQENTSFQAFQFEEVELDNDLRVPLNSSEAKEAVLHFEVPNIELPMAIAEVEMKITTSYPYELAKSVVMIMDIPVTTEQNHSPSHDGNCLLDGRSTNIIQLPNFEISEIDFVVDYTADSFNLHLPTIESSHNVIVDNLEVNVAEFLQSAVSDILEPTLECVPFEHCEDKDISLDSLLDMDIISLNNSTMLDKSSVVFQLMPDGGCSSFPCSISFLEVEVLDPPHAFPLFENHQIVSEEDKPECIDSMDTEGKLYDFFVSSELVLEDDSFKSLPTPIMADDRFIKSFSVIVGEILHIIKPHPFSACDGIYLDWHLLLEGPCNREVCSAYMQMVELHVGKTSFELEFSDELEMGILLLNYLDDSTERPRNFNCEEKETELQFAFRKGKENPDLPKVDKGEIHREKSHKQESPPKLDKQEIYRNKNHKQTSLPGTASLLFESTTQSNELSYFLDVRRGIYTKSEDRTSKMCSGKAVTIDSLEKASVPGLSHEHFSECWDVEVHQLSLSDHILDLVGEIQKSYLSIIDNCKDLRRKYPLPDRDIVFPSFPMEKLLRLITDRNRSSSGYKDEELMAYISIYAIKQLTYLLCFFGVHIAHLYINNLIRNVCSLSYKLESLESLVKEECRKAEKELFQTYPPLNLIQDIVNLNASQNGKKVLIIAERVFWIPLNLKLSSLTIKSQKLKVAQIPETPRDVLEKSELSSLTVEALQHADCLLISHKNISPSFPFNKFSIILEYGGSRATAIISNITPNASNLPRVHFLTVNIEKHIHVRAILDGCDISYCHSEMEKLSPPQHSLQGIWDNEYLIKLLNFIPTEEKNGCNSLKCASTQDTHSGNGPEKSMSMTCPEISKDTVSLAEVVIVVNTQNIDKKMLISRRSSYQKILANEKRGAQVVEREINLPLDLVISASVCLVWYDTSGEAENDATITAIGKSSAPLFVENIATNILLSLSFAFSGCVMIFEGDNKFLANIMESSDALYAAAASLGISLQLFCSYVPESTDEIILNCIDNTSRSNRGLFPAMPELESLGEAFLTRFPSINPLAAHAILSSGGMLVEFLEWSHELRIQAVGKYHLHQESMSLFSALSRYGELGESKSVMTESSSTGSDVNTEKMQSQRKRKKTVDMPVEFNLFAKPREQFDSGSVDQLEACRPYSSMFVDAKRIYGESEHHNPILDRVTGETCRLTSTMVDDLGQHRMNGFTDLREDLGKKIYDDSVDQNLSFLNDSFPLFPEETYFCGKPETTIKSAHTNTGHRTFPSAAEINSDQQTSSKINMNSEDGFREWLGRGSYNSYQENPPRKHQVKMTDDNYLDECKRNYLGLSIQESESPVRRNEPSADIIHSPKQKGSNWTFEFLNMFKEKRKMHHQNLLGNTSNSFPGSTNNKTKYPNKRSPSIIETFRYEGRAQTKKSAGPKLIKTVNVQPTSRSKESEFSVISPTWTPIDKRARQNLSFIKNGKDKQSKLVWRSNNSPAIGYTPRKRFRGEG